MPNERNKCHFSQTQQKHLKKQHVLIVLFVTNNSFSTITKICIILNHHAAYRFYAYFMCFSGVQMMMMMMGTATPLKTYSNSNVVINSVLCDSS